MRKTIKRTGFIAVSAVALTSVGVAFAAWTAGGDGSGTSKATTAQALTTTAAEATADLYPGKTNGNLKITINNPNPYPVTVTGITAGTGSVSAAGGTGTCTVTGVSLNSGLTSLSLAVPSGSSTHTVPNAVSMSNLSDTGCQGATFTIPVTLAGASAAS